MTSLNLELYRKLYLIRKAEEAICRHYGEDEMKTPVHLSLGEEAITTGVVHALSPEDQLLKLLKANNSRAFSIFPTTGIWNMWESVKTFTAGTVQEMSLRNGSRSIRSKYNGRSC